MIDCLTNGPPDPARIQAARLKRPKWYSRYALTLLGCVCTYAMFVHPLIISRVLNAEPDWAQMQTLDVHILKTRHNDPHFEMQLADGRVLHMEWPVTINFFTGRKRYHLWEKEQRLALVGCRAKVQVAPVRWTLTDRYRVWSLSCPSTGFYVGVDQTAQDLRRSLRATVVANWLSAPLFLLMVFIVFIREKRGVL
mgnify:CR=1 FL=1